MGSDDRPWRGWGAAPALAAVFLLAAACGGVDGLGTPVPVGAWSGDVVLPGETGAVRGATWHVVWSDSSPGLELSVTLPTEERVGPVPLAADEDSLRFPLPFAPSAGCEVTRREDGSWRGACSPVDGRGEVEVVLQPPTGEQRCPASGRARERASRAAAEDVSRA